MIWFLKLCYTREVKVSESSSFRNTYWKLIYAVWKIDILRDRLKKLQKIKILTLCMYLYGFHNIFINPNFYTFFTLRNILYVYNYCEAWNTNTTLKMYFLQN